MKKFEIPKMPQLSKCELLNTILKRGPVLFFCYYIIYLMVSFVFLLFKGGQ